MSIDPELRRTILKVLESADESLLVSRAILKKLLSAAESPPACTYLQSLELQLQIKSDELAHEREHRRKLDATIDEIRGLIG
jgi:hypothetical protein